MEDTVGLASSLGLINKGTAAFGGNVLTRASGKELDINIAEKKAEAARLAKQAQEEKVLLGKMKVGGKFDELARREVEKNTSEMLRTKGYLDPQRLASYDYDIQRQEEATKERAAAKDILSKNKYLIPEKDSAAFQNSDISYLEERTKDPTSGITKDPNLPNVYRLAPEKLIPKINIGEALNKSTALLSKGDYDYSRKNVVNVNGRIIVQVPLKTEALNRTGQIFLQDDINYKNFTNTYKPDILKAMKSNPTMEEPAAALKVYTDKLSQIGKMENDVTPSAGLTINNQFSSTGKGTFENKKIRLTEVEPTSEIKQGEYLYKFIGTKPDVLNLNVGGKNDVVKKFKDVTYVGKIDDTKGYVLGTRKMTIAEMQAPENEAYLNAGGDTDNFPARVEVPLSVIKGVLQIDESTWNKLNSVSGPAAKATVKAKASTGGAMTPVKNPLITKKGR